MSKLYNKPIQVRMAGTTLTAFLWRDRWLRVVAVEKVERRGSWWEVAPTGETYRVRTHDNGLFDLVVDKGNWVLERVWD